MKRVQIQLTAAQADALRRRSDATEKSVAALVREAVDSWIAADDRERRTDRALAAIGGFHSGLGDLAENHDRYLDEDGST